MVREYTMYRILYSYFLERIFSVVTGHINKLFSVVCIALGLSAFIVVLVLVQVTGGFREMSVNVMKKLAQYHQTLDDEGSYSELKER